MSATTDTVETIEAQFKHSDVDVETGAVTVQLDMLVNDYQFTVPRARRATVNSLLDEASIEKIGCGTLDQPDQWVDIQAQVVELWEPASEQIAQVGLLNDDTGTVLFISPETSHQPPLEEGENYYFDNAVTDDCDGKCSVRLSRLTEVTPLGR